MLLRDFYKRKHLQAPISSSEYLDAIFVVDIWSYNGRLQTHCHSEGVNFPMASISSHFIVRELDSPNQDENLKHHKVMTVNLRQRNYCYYDKDTGDNTQVLAKSASRDF